MIRSCIISAILTITFGLKAQQTCYNATVYFASDVDTLTEAERQRLDSLFASVTGPVLLELTGHTDDVDGEEYNLQLSDRRVESVWEYLAANYQVVLYQRFAFGETQPVEPNRDAWSRAANRRVNIGIVPLDSGRVSFYGPKGEVVKVDTQYIQGRSICAMVPVFTTYLTDGELNDGGLPLPEDQGAAFHVIGLTRFAIEGMDDTEQPCFPMEMTIPYIGVHKHFIPCGTTVDDVWGIEPYKIIKNDTIARTVTILIDCDKPNKERGGYSSICCCTHNYVPYCVAPFDSLYIVTPNGVKPLEATSFYFLGGEMTTVYRESYWNDYTGASKLTGDENVDWIVMAQEWPFFVWHNDAAYSGKLKDITLVIDTVIYDYLSCEYSYYYHLKFALHTRQQWSDTTVEVRLKRVRADGVSFYNVQFEYSYPLTQTGENIYTGRYFLLPHKLAIDANKKSPHLLDYADVKTRYKKKRKLLKVKVKRKHLK